MAVKFLRISTTVALFVALCMTPAAADEIAFDAKAVVTMDIAVEGDKQSLVADTAFGYRWTSEKPGERTLSLTSMGLRISINSELQVDYAMSRNGTTRTKDGEKSEEAFENATPTTQKLLTELFGTPLCRMQIDNTGKATSVEILPNPSLQKIGQTDVITTAMFGHPEPPGGRDEWSAESRLSSGKGGLVSGLLRYKKDGDGKGRYSVNGKLSNPLIRTPEGPTIRDSVYIVGGHLVFDETKKMWMGGDIELIMSFKMFDGEKKQAEASGTMKLTIEPRKVKAVK